MNPDWQFRAVAGPLIPLANQFYKRVNKHMKARGDETVWLGECDGSIRAALRLRPLESPYVLLTGMLVAPDARGQGWAAALLQAAATTLRAGETFLFCEPGLVNLYRRAGFARASSLPPALASRLARYQRKTPHLTAMVWTTPDGTTAV
ncbi:GNAT family N-acetyltransferase [Simiduia agarivorans]|uniref:GNAT family acetyltransferase n=1 Tax=Simiduia agarivorans (strain DSM 21679 / JCM 13881 / BCRC 17597 / SA1) TaxID=1117647 RepID=R9S567_SIMAS|nr:GNAT family N-acetyltransferase [Simiduia agarivorans]AGN11360.1 GNAT family acetyltransferase [Simiduia agarivorans SA1 = DSM 21679]